MKYYRKNKKRKKGGVVKIGGSSGQIQADNLVEIFEKFEGVKKGFERQALYCDSLTLVFKDEKGKLMCLGNCGIDLEVNQRYLPKPKKKLMLCYHFHS